MATIQINEKRRAELLNEATALEKRARDANEEAYELVNGDGEFSDSKLAAKHTTLLQRATLAEADAQRKREELATLPEPVLKSTEREDGAFTRFLRGGINELGEDEVRLYCSNETGEKKLNGTFNLGEYARQAGGEIARQYGVTRTDLETGTGAAKQATPDTVGNMLIHRLKYEGSVATVARNMSTPTGNTFRYPYLDDTGNEGADDDQVQGAAIGNANLGTITGDEFTGTLANSGFVTVQEEALEDISSFSLEATIMDLLRRRIGRRLNVRMTTTQAGNKITGVVNAAGGNFNQAVAGDIKWQDLLDVMKTVDGAYIEGTEGGAYSFVQDPLGGGVVWMCHRNTLFELFKIKDGDDRPLLRPDMNAGGTVTPWGYAVMQNNRMPLHAAGNKSLLFGNFGYYLVRNIGDIRIRRISGDTDKSLAANNQVAFVAIKRFDAGLIAHTSGSSRADYTIEALATYTSK